MRREKLTPDAANEVISILKLDNLKEEEMRRQIGVFMELTNESFSKLRTLAKTIKDFQNQMKRPIQGQIDRGTEFGLDFDEEAAQDKFERDDQGNIRHRRSQYDMEMTLGNRELEEEEMVREVLEMDEHAADADGGSGKANKTRTPSQRNRKVERPRDRAQGIQSVLLQKEPERQSQSEEEDREDSQPRQPSFDRGRDFLDKHLRTGTLTPAQLATLVDILGQKEDGDCQNQLISFVEAHEDVLNSDVAAIKEVYDNREEVFFNLSLDLLREDAPRLDAVIARMKKSELGREMLEQKARGGESGHVGQILLESKEMQEILEKSTLLEKQLNAPDSLDNETLAGLAKTTFHMKFKVRRSTAAPGKKIKMPRGTSKLTEKGYEVVKMPAETRKSDFGIEIKRVKQVLPEFMHRIFGEIEKLNAIQVSVTSRKSSTRSSIQGTMPSFVRPPEPEKPSLPCWPFSA